MKIPQTTWLIPVLIATALTLAGCGGSGGGGSDDDTGGSPDERSVGKKIFFDQSLSSNGNQSCGSCHDPAAGFADPNASSAAPVSAGSFPGRFGNRNAPTAAYASFIPVFGASTKVTPDGSSSNYKGGQFLDGRRDTLAEQAKDPFLNPDEMNMTRTAIVTGVKNSSYANEFKQVYGANAFDDEDQTYDNIAAAIAAFESSNEVNPFTSKFDLDRANFTASEERGFQVFNDPNRGKCANCHTTDPDPISGKVLFTDYNYFNVGTPPNPNNPGAAIDGGLGDANRNPAIPAGQQSTELGKFRTPTLRNIACTAPYMHNGIFETLAEVTAHYDLTVADYIADPVFFSLVNPDKVPEVTTNIANELTLGLGLDNDNSDGITDYQDLEEFLKTLSDGYPDSTCN